MDPTFPAIFPFFSVVVGKVLSQKRAVAEFRLVNMTLTVHLHWQSLFAKNVGYIMTRYCLPYMPWRLRCVYTVAKIALS